MNISTSSLGRAREQVDMHMPVVVGAALKLAIAGPTHSNREHARIDAGLTQYHWKLHSSRVIHLAETLRSILPGAT